MQKNYAKNVILQNAICFSAVMRSTKFIHFMIKLIENKELSFSMHFLNIICSRYAQNITLHRVKKSIENDEQLLLFAINYSFVVVAKFLIKIKTIYMRFSNFFPIVV